MRSLRNGLLQTLLILLGLASLSLAQLEAPVEAPDALSLLPAAGETYRDELEVLAEEPSGPLRAARRLRLLRDLGRGAEVVATGGELPEEWAAARYEVALAQVDLGQRDAARELLEELANSRNEMELASRYELGELAWHRGERSAAEEWWFGLIQAYNQRSTLSSRDLVAVGRACRRLGYSDPALFQDALKAFDEALRIEPSNAEVRAHMGSLFVAKYDAAQAGPLLDEAMNLDPDAPETLYALAQLHHFNGSPSTRGILERLLEVQPNHVEGMVFQSRLLSELEDQAGAEEIARAALLIDPDHLQARSMLAVALYLQGKSEAFRTEERAILERNASWADLYVLLAELSVQNRLYEEAKEFARRAVSLDEQSAEGWSLLGMNRLRLGEMVQGRADLERAFASDPYNVWNKNTLDLLDKVDAFETDADERFVIVADSDEAHLMSLYVRALANEAYEHLAARYRYEPRLPIRIEVYADHQDFSVRTVGLAGLGALGVSFGSLLAVDSPAARAPGDFNWGTTLWHELAHTFTLGVTKNRIPRWLTEGLSVHEERQSRYTGWGDDVQPVFVQLLAEGELLGLREINEGFVRPKFPNQIALSYFQASLIVEWIERHRGWDAMRRILSGYAGGETTETVFERELEMTLEEFDRLFFNWLRERYEGALGGYAEEARLAREARAQAEAELAESASEGAGGEPTAEQVEAEAEREAEPSETGSEPVVVEVNVGTTTQEPEQWAANQPENFRALLAWGAELLEQKQPAEAELIFTRARDLFPEFVSPGSGYHGLVSVYESTGQRDQLIEALGAIVDRYDFSYAEHVALADALAERSGGALTGPDADRELDVLERLMWIYPFTPQQHGRLAELARAAGQFDLAERELRAYLALDPPSRPQARLDLARLLRTAGRADEARVEILLALELAPDFVEAQELLLELLDEAVENG